MKQKQQLKQLNNNQNDESKILRSLTPQERRILTLFENTDTITSNDIAKLFNFTQRSARNLVNKLVNKNFLEIENTSNKNRSYRLNKKFVN